MTNLTTSSKWENPAAAVITDPDCPPPPAAPFQSLVSILCQHDVAEWRQYAFRVPPKYAGGTRGSFPIVTLTTKETEVRHVRVTVLDDRMDHGMRELNHCDFLGKFFIDYIPPHTTITVDASARSALANVRGSGETSALNLVSDGYGGPAKWPVLRGDVTHYVTVDVTPEALESVDIRVGIVRRVH